ncbi:MAG: SGNH/GDSL hydrolase family protein [Thermoanaerobaculia bacterium]
MRNGLFKIAVVAASALLALIAVEQGLRFIDWQYRPLSVEVRDIEDARGFHLFKDDHFVYDPRLIWRPKPGFGVFNSQGLRGPELSTRRLPGELRIVTIGDSNTLGWAGEDGANWPRDLDRRLRETGRPATVANAGVWGYSSAQGLARLEEVLRYSPQLVLISFGANDAHPVSRSDREFAESSHFMRGLTRWLTHFRVGQLVAAVFANGSSDQIVTARVPLEKYRENLERMVAMAREGGSEPILLTRPFVGPVDSVHKWKYSAFDYNAATIEIAARENVLVVDLYSSFKGRDELFSDESHFTDEGHRLAGGIVADHLAPLLNDLTRE